MFYGRTQRSIKAKRYTSLIFKQVRKITPSYALFGKSIFR
ncbi:hypothetical protein M076_3274 [Bacteroides fragilis str. 2-F-2 |uniref:Uncharacterized protein n=1 Tax=Bacteroides fragilis str. 2-F-2 \|nr:hypothetical protein M145_2928 [Bacteroides fragilis str. 34-F-2 \